MINPSIHRCVFWAHLVAGIAAGSVILVLAVTGLLMSFESQIIDQVERTMVRQKAGGDVTPLTAAEMVAAFEKAGIRESPDSLCYSSDEDTPVAFIAGRGNQHFFHPTTGEYLGKGAEKTRPFFKTVLSIHRWLTLRGEAPPGPPARGGKETNWKDTGARITAATTLVLLFLLVSGLIIWIPRKPAWRAFKAVITLQPRLKGRARDWNWHNVAGIWASPFVLTICLTGLIMAYPWANRLLFQAFGETPPGKREQAGGRRGETGGGRKEPIASSRLDALADFAKRRVPTWNTIVMDLPASGKQPLVVTVTNAGRGRPDRREKFTLDPGSLAVVKHETFRDAKPGQRARQIVRWLHTGEIGGWPGQSLAALSCAAVIALIWTGFALSFRRFLLKRKPTSV